MKINTSRRFSSSQPEASSPQAEALASGGGYNYTRPVRFKNMSELMSRYEDARKKRGEQRAWNNILKAFERQPWKDKDGTILPNFGFLRSKVEDKLNSYVDYATERENWARVTTYEGTDALQTKSWSDHITAAFNKYCIGRWEKKAIEVILACRDMCLFSKGAMPWLDTSDIYPKNLPIQNIWPDSNAGMTADTFDVLFMEQRYTQVELYRKIESPDAHLKGWNRDNVLKILRSRNASWHDCTKDEVFLKYKNGETTSQDEDGFIDVVWAFVKEYPRRQDGTRELTETISMFIFVRSGFVPTKKNSTDITSGDLNNAGYLLYLPNYAGCMDQTLAIVAQSVCRNFYEDPSVAEQCYTSAKTYDQVMNRILQGIEDNMRVYFASTSTDGFNKMKRMKHGNSTFLEPGMTLATQQIRRPVQEAMAALRMVSNESDSLTQSYQVNSRDQGGGYKTAKQTEIDFNQSLKLDSASLKIFNQFCALMVKEIYRRFLTVEDACKYDKKSQELFRRYLKRHNVPLSAADPENVKVESILDLGAASPAARLQAGQITLQTLATPARSEGERQAQRDIIGSVHGVENVETYLPQVEPVTEEDWRIGIENDALMSPGGNPGDVQVLPEQLHLRHIPRHLETATITLQKAAQYFQAIPQMNPDDTGIHVKQVMDMVLGIDQTLAHTRAHIQIAAQTSSQPRQEELKVYANQANTLAGQQDKLLKALEDMEGARMQQAQERNGTDPELTHKQRMYDLDYQQKQRMYEIDTQTAITKGQQLSAQSAENAQQKQALEAAKATQDMALANQRSQVDTAISARKKLNGN